MRAPPSEFIGMHFIYYISRTIIANRIVVHVVVVAFVVAVVCAVLQIMRYGLEKRTSVLFSHPCRKIPPSDPLSMDTVLYYRVACWRKEKA